MHMRRMALPSETGTEHKKHKIRAQEAQRGRAATKGEATKGTKGTKEHGKSFCAFCASCGPPKNFVQQTRIHRLVVQKERGGRLLFVLLVAALCFLCSVPVPLCKAVETVRDQL